MIKQLLMFLAVFSCAITQGPSVLAQSRNQSPTTGKSTAEDIRDSAKVVVDTGNSRRWLNRQAVFQKIQGSGKLEVAVLQGAVFIEGWDHSFWGNNYVRIKAPVEMRYFLNLKNLREADFIPLSDRQLIKVKMPAVEFSQPSVDLQSLEVVEKSNPFFRKAAAWYELKDMVLSTKVNEEACNLAEANLPEARLSAQGTFRDLVRTICSPLMPNVEVLIQD